MGRTCQHSEGGGYAGKSKPFVVKFLARNREKRKTGKRAKRYD